MILGSLPVVTTHRTAGLVDNICRGRGVDILRMYQLEVLLTVALLSRLQVHHIREWLLGVVEWHILQACRIGIVATGKREVAVLVTVKPVDSL